MSRWNKSDHGFWLVGIRAFIPHEKQKKIFFDSRQLKCPFSKYCMLTWICCLIYLPIFSLKKPHEIFINHGLFLPPLESTFLKLWIIRTFKYFYCNGKKICLDEKVALCETDEMQIFQLDLFLLIQGMYRYKVKNNIKRILKFPFLFLFAKWGNSK